MTVHELLEMSADDKIKELLETKKTQLRNILTVKSVRKKVSTSGSFRKRH